MLNSITGHQAYRSQPNSVVSQGITTRQGRFSSIVPSNSGLVNQLRESIPSNLNQPVQSFDHLGSQLQFNGGSTATIHTFSESSDYLNESIKERRTKVILGHLNPTSIKRGSKKIKDPVASKLEKNPSKDLEKQENWLSIGSKKKNQEQEIQLPKSFGLDIASTPLNKSSRDPALIMKNIITMEQRKKDLLDNLNIKMANPNPTVSELLKVQLDSSHLDMMKYCIESAYKILDDQKQNLKIPSKL